MEVTGEPVGDHSIPKGRPRRRPGSALWRCEQMGHEGLMKIILLKYFCRNGIEEKNNYCSNRSGIYEKNIAEGPGQDEN